MIFTQTFFRRISLQCALSALLLACAAAAGCGSELSGQDSIRTVKAVQVGLVETLDNLFLPGRAEATQEVNLGFEVSGTLVKRPVDKGDRVEKGQLLAQLDLRDFTNMLESARAEYDRARAHRDRIREAEKTGAVARQQLTDAEAKLNVAEAQVQIKKKALEDATILAPFSGSVAATYVENYQQVVAKQQVLRLLDVSKIEITVNFPENLITYVKHVPQIWCRFDTMPGRNFPVRVKEIGMEASQATRTYPVTVIMDQPPDIEILPGMAAEVFGRVTQPEAISVRSFDIPLAAVFSDGKEPKSFLWTINMKDMTVHRREIKTGDLTSTGITVLEGISRGEWIVTAGVHYLAEGQKVQLQQGSPGGAS